MYTIVSHFFKDRKQSIKWREKHQRTSRHRSGRSSAASGHGGSSAEDEPETLSVSQDDVLLSSPRRRRKQGVVEGPPSGNKFGGSSLYDLSYIDEEQPLSVNEISQRARRRRKDTLDEVGGETVSQDAMMIAGGSAAAGGGDGGMKRRNTINRKGGSGGSTGGTTADAGDCRTAKGSITAGTVSKQDKTMGTTKAGEQRRQRLMSEAEGEGEAAFKSSLLDKANDTDEEDEEEEQEEKLDEKNVTFCMWGHENCKTRSHYRYNWQWDYVQKYVDQHHKNMLSGYLPKDGEPSRQGGTDDKFEAKACSNKPSKDGIKVRLQMLQNRLSQGKTSDSVKQKMFERDLELEMLRRKKTYQF